MSCTNNLFSTEITSINLGICKPSTVYFWIAVITVFVLQIGRHCLWTLSGKNHRELMSLSKTERNNRCDLFGCLELIQLGKSSAYAISIILLVSGNGWVIISHILGDFAGSWIAFHVVSKDEKHILHNIITKYKKLKESSNEKDKQLLNDFINMIQESKSSSDKSSKSPGNGERVESFFSRRRSDILF